MSDDLYIWIVRWPDFQHYTPERDRAPAWIKRHVAEMDDERYLTLSNRERALLHDLRTLFARTRARLRYDRRTIAAYRQAETRQADLEALNDAGLIEVVSRATLEKYLEQLYNGSRASRARPRAREEVEEEGPPLTPPQTRGGNGQRLTTKDLRRYTGCRHTRGTHGTGYKRDPLGTDKPPADWPHDKPTADEVRAALAEQAKIEAGRF